MQRALSRQMLPDCARALQECSRLHTRKLCKRSRFTTQTSHVHLNLNAARKLSQRFFLGLRLCENETS